MATTPQDHKSKNFTFEYQGKTYTFEKDFSEVRKPGWLRKNRRRDELDLAFTILETVAGEKALEAIDEMNEDEFKDLMSEVEKEMGETLGN